MNKLWLGAAVVLTTACADAGKKSAVKADTAKPVVVEKVSAVDSAELAAEFQLRAGAHRSRTHARDVSVRQPQNRQRGDVCVVAR